MNGAEKPARAFKNAAQKEDKMTKKDRSEWLSLLSEEERSKYKLARTAAIEVMKKRGRLDDGDATREMTALMYRIFWLKREQEESTGITQMFLNQSKVCKKYLEKAYKKLEETVSLLDCFWDSGKGGAYVTQGGDAVERFVTLTSRWQEKGETIENYNGDVLSNIAWILGYDDGSPLQSRWIYPGDELTSRANRENTHEGFVLKNAETLDIDKNREGWNRVKDGARQAIDQAIIRYLCGRLIADETLTLMNICRLALPETIAEHIMILQDAVDAYLVAIEREAREAPGSGEDVAELWKKRADDAKQKLEEMSREKDAQIAEINRRVATLSQQNNDKDVLISEYKKKLQEMELALRKTEKKLTENNQEQNDIQEVANGQEESVTDARLQTEEIVPANETEEIVPINVDYSEAAVAYNLPDGDLLRKYIEDKMPGIKFVTGVQTVPQVKVVVLLIRQSEHGFYYRIKDEAKNKGIAFIHYNGTNANMLMKEINKALTESKIKESE